MKYPKISVIIPTFNEGEKIEKCIESILSQDYPKRKIETIVVDDGSTDETVEIAKGLDATILYSGEKNIERSKSRGLERASGEFVFFIDADNRLTSDVWFKKCVQIYQEHPEVVGINTYKFLYKKNDSLPNRYSALFGINDPFVFYLGKRGLMMETEKKWVYPKTVLEEKQRYILVKFDTKNLPTMGSQGYFTRKKLLLESNWEPYLFHLDSAYDLVKKGYCVFAMLKIPVEHDYANSLISMFKKLHRNVELFWKFQKIRRYRYDTSILKFMFVIMLMITFVIPLVDALKGYIKKKDIAWFAHPLICFSVVILYSYSTVKHFLRNLVK